MARLQATWEKEITTTRASTICLQLAQSLSFTSVAFIDELDYQIKIYPSADTKSSFLSAVPWIAALVVALIFVFTGSVFVAYSFFVDRRQAILMKRAITSGSIVSSLFPSQVTDKIYDQKESKLVFDAAKTGRSGNDAPIADKFEHTTIIFADIKNFTRWSSDWSPEDVFVLLETLYGAFGAFSIQRYVLSSNLFSPRSTLQTKSLSAEEYSRCRRLEVRWLEVVEYLRPAQQCFSY